MKRIGATIIVMTFSLIVGFSGGILSQESAPKSEDFLTTVENTLKDTESPLTDELKEKLKGVEPGPSYRQDIVNMLDDNQKEAVVKALRSPRSNAKKPGGDGSTSSSSSTTSSRRGGSRNRTGRTQKVDLKTAAKQLQQARKPLTGTQLEYLLKIENDPEFSTKINEVLDDDQKAVLKGSGRGGRSSGRGRRR